MNYFKALVDIHSRLNLKYHTRNRSIWLTIISEMGSDRDGSKTTGGFFDHGAKSTPEKKQTVTTWTTDPHILTIRTSVQTSHFLDECAIYHAMLKLRAFLLQKGISCYSGVMVAHSSGKWEVCGSSPSCSSLVLFWSTLSPMDKITTSGLWPISV